MLLLVYFMFDCEMIGFFLLESTVADLPSTILITFPYVEGFTSIGRGYSYYSFCSTPIIGAYFQRCSFDYVLILPIITDVLLLLIADWLRFF